jgi:hypothetical protein
MPQSTNLTLLSAPAGDGKKPVKPESKRGMRIRLACPKFVVAVLSKESLTNE